MPNWCENNLRISGNEEAMQKFISKLNTVKDETPRLSFNALLPLPKDQEDNWYTWQSAYWGTKWDITDGDDGEVPYVFSPGYLEYVFDTAWAPPIALLKNITKEYPELTFALAYAESGQCFAGIYEIRDGEELNEEYYHTMKDVNSIAEDFFGTTYYDEADFDMEEED